MCLGGKGPNVSELQKRLGVLVFRVWGLGYVIVYSSTKILEYSTVYKSIDIIDLKPKFLPDARRRTPKTHTVSLVNSLSTPFPSHSWNACNAVLLSCIR